MTAVAKPEPVDAAARKAAVAERGRNVLIDAGAGTGKTTIIVDRFVELLAPSDDAPHIPIERMAAVTFTRRAAGELRLRIREGILRAIASPATSTSRQERLRTALAGLDSAWIGTIHSFADRLLRLEPMASGLSPTYEILEDADELHRETWHSLQEASAALRLSEVLAGTEGEPFAAEAQQTFNEAVALGLRTQTMHYPSHDALGLDAMVAGFINRRDTPPLLRNVPRVDFRAFRKAVEEFAPMARQAGRDSAAQKFLHVAADRLERLVSDSDPARVMGELRDLIAGAPKKAAKGADFVDDIDGWAAWKAWSDGDEPFKERLLRPFVRWLAVRLARTFPAVIARYEQVKSRHEVLDQIDLLLKLRDLLRDRLDVRARLQALFDHLFVDEFQDTDPLQAEVLMFLCEEKSAAAKWEDVKLAAGKLTIVGDPKQSIYRFRRADVQMYDAVRTKIAASAHLAVALKANFRSTPPLIDWFNDRFEVVLGTPKARGQQFDAATGQVFHAPLAAGVSERKGEPVLRLPTAPKETTVDPARRFEAEAWARGIRWLVEKEKPQVRDPLTGEWRALRYGDIAVLAHVTTNVSVLLEAFDANGVPWSARGGRLFLEDPLHRQFVLGLRALANRDDGVAQMALHRPPFFAVALSDLALARQEPCPADVQARLKPIDDLIADLRMRRFDRLPGETARDLLERSAFGRHVALGPNGAQRLSQLRELCFVLDRLALKLGLDFDAATAELRDWVTGSPPQLDPPHPVASEVVQVLSIHQAKGLEYPMVALWDAQAKWAPQRDADAWLVSRDGTEWAIALERFKWAEPEAAGFADRDFTYAGTERQRLIYVAATRARDLLVIPSAGDRMKPESFIMDRLIEAAPKGTVRVLPQWVDGEPEPEWAEDTHRFEFATLPAAPAQLVDTAEWDSAAAAAAKATLAPIAVSKEAIRVVEAMRAEDEDEVAEPPEKAREGRFGRAFGSTVHRALGLALLDASLPLGAAVARAAKEYELTAHFAEAEADVKRTLETLAASGLARGAVADFAIEYPVAMPSAAGLLGGFIDLLVAKPTWMVIDFKTDRRPQGDAVAAHPEYAEQVRSYARILEQGGLAGAGAVKAALLFTETGELVDVPMCH